MSKTSSSGDSHSQVNSSGAEGASPIREVDDTVSILDIVLVLVQGKSLILWCTAVCMVFGIAFAVLSDDQYTASTRVVREAQEDAPSVGGIGGLGALRGLGLSLGGAASGLTTDAYPSVLNSREVLLGVARTPFPFEGYDRPISFVEYVDEPPTWTDKILKYTIGLPGVISGSSDEAPVTLPTDSTKVDALTEAESEAIEVVAEMVATSVDQETGFMTIQTKAGSAQLAADLASSFLDHLTARIREIRTEKVREQLQFVETRFSEVEQELNDAEQRLATFLERNQNPTTASLRFEEDRLRRQVSFKEELYSNLQSQVTQTRIDVKRQQPVVTVVERPVVPREPSAPNRIVIVLLSVVLGVIFGVAASFIRVYASSARSTGESKEKMEQIESALGTGWTGRVLRRWNTIDEGAS